MNNVDRIIKYLSDELDRSESEAFKRDLASDPRLKEEFETVAQAYRLIGEELRRRDQEAFRKTLRTVMEESLPIEKKGWRQRPLWFFLLPAAASVALLTVLFLWKQSETDRLVSRYYHPENDPVVLALQQGTRGPEGSAIHLFTTGNFREAQTACVQILDCDPGNQRAMLFYLLSSLELEERDMALEWINGISIPADHQVGQAIHWYASLASAGSGMRDEALRRLELLTAEPGPYRKDAEKLKKSLLK